MKQEAVPIVVADGGKETNQSSNSVAAAPVSGEDALANALMKVLAAQSKTTEKFVARQSLESKLPTFSGNPLDWPLFLHHFKQSTDDCGFTLAQNMARLERSLKGDARRSVKALMIVPNNTGEVMRRLEQRYGRHEFVIQALVDLAKKTPTAKDSKLSSIIDYSNAITNLVTTVQTLNEPSHLQNPQLMKELVEKLPDNLKLQWGQVAMTKKTRSLADFSSWVSDIATAASLVTTPKFKLEERKERGEKDEAYTATTDDAVRSCSICLKEGHEPWSCIEFKKADVNARWDTVKKKKLCFVSLKSGHGIRTCRSIRTCGVNGCTRKHNRLLHPKDEKEPKFPFLDSTRKSDETNGNANQTSKSPVLLRVLPVKLYGPGGEVIVNALIDDASSVTMLDVKVAEKLKFFCFHQSETDNDVIHNLMKESFHLESIGIRCGEKLSSKEDVLAESKMELMTKRVGERWETGLLWRHDVTCLPPSANTAIRRLMGVERRLNRDENLREEYTAKIKYYLDAGYARLLTNEEVKIPTAKQWFLPHFATSHPNKPGKIRIVFDAASKSRGSSLNDHLLTGPDLLVSLPGVLLKFRQKKIAFTGDITEMFHQVKIREEDCPAQRFLWRDDGETQPKVYQLEVMMFGSVCSPYCAQYVKNRNAQEFAEVYPDAVSAITEKHYMDDYLDSCDTVKEASQLVKDVALVHRRGGFEIGKWVSNSPELLCIVKNEDRSTSDGCVNDCAPRGAIPPERQFSSIARVDVKNTAKDFTDWSKIETERVLGLHWDYKSDAFTFRVNLQRAGDGIATGERIPTKREVLRLVMLIFDPLGFLNHFTVKARILLQHLWRSKIGWDDKIPLEQQKRWTKWVSCLPAIRNIQIPRCYSHDASRSTSVQLHVFADASEAAYCAVAFLRVVRSDREIDLNVVMTKSRVSPIKPTSIPRLELQAALIATRMGKFILEHLEICVHGTYLWTDSQTVLKWIRSEARRYQQFVANRVGEIQELSTSSQWRWVPTKLNVADDATREGKADLSSNSRWWTGPDFLKLNEDNWPSEEPEMEETDSDEMELKREYVGAVFEPPVYVLPDINRFSIYLRLVRATAWVLTFIDCLKKTKDDSPLQLRTAENLLFQQSQWESYPEEMSALSTGDSVKKSSVLYSFSPCVDFNNVMRMDSRLVNSEKEELRQPIILSQNHRLTCLLISHYHRNLNHAGQDLIVNEMRQRFWIPHIRSAVRKICRDCGYCKVKRMKAKTPQMGALPIFRIQPQSRPFTIVGMDYFGPMEVTVGRRHEKRYGVLFTCLTVRAVHLEIAHSLTTDSCIMAIRRMIGRRGMPKEIHSDNGTNLRGPEKELRKALEDIDQNHMRNVLETKGIRWHFIPPSSPHMGGSWERLVRSVKDAMRVILKSRAPKEEVLQTVFAEAEATVNTRPLTDIPVDPSSPEALTPMHFMIGTSSALQPPGEFDDKDLDLSKRWRCSQRLADMYWNRWVREYLPTLQRRSKWHAAVPPVEVGDLVVILDESLRRNTWPLGIVVAVFPGKDGQVRVAEVRTSHGVYRRPVVKLGKLDIKAAEPP